MLGGNAQDFARRLGDLERDLSLDVAVQQVRQAFGFYGVHGGDLLVVCLVLEPDREDTLLLQVGLVDSGEGSSDNQVASVESRLERSVFTSGTFTVVFVDDEHPWLTSSLVSLHDAGDRVFALLIKGNVDGATFVVNSGDQGVLGNVAEMTLVLEPRTGGGDVISRALATNPHQALHHRQLESVC